MKIVFTGSSSFTGFWFIRQLVEAGHEVVATFRGKNYEGVRGRRVDLIKKLCPTLFESPFGSDSFLDLIQSQPFELLCHHAAEVSDYKCLHFDVVKALQSNVYRLPTVLDLLKPTCVKVVLTGSLFEQHEGIGSHPQRAFSPYGLSKGLTAEYFTYYCQRIGIFLGKFVIPNPFGPYEDPRLTTFLVRSWAKKESPVIKTPDYIRDNIPVAVLAKAYLDFVEKSEAKRSPSGYVESQGAFIQRFAQAMRPRLNLPCQIEWDKQKSFPEPRMRINSDPVDFDWSEQKQWDDLAIYYQKMLKETP